MKRCLSLVLVFALVIACAPVIPLQADAATIASGTCGNNLTWAFDNTGTLTISGTGWMSHYYSTDAPWYHIRTAIKKVVIEDGITSIGDYAFSSCSSLTSVVIGDSVTSIGYAAFYNCSSLTSVVIGDSVISIGNYAFENCSSLTSIEIPDSVTSIGNYAFNYCSSLTSVVIGDSVTSIGNGAFRYCSSLTSIEISDSVTSIGNYAFENCSSLTSVVILDSVTYIGDSAFYNCSSLTSIEIPDSVTSIGDYAFYSCSSLTSVVIGDSVTSIGDSAFRDCSSLTSVELGSGVVGIPAYCFDGCSSLENMIIPESVISIGDGAFRDCSALTSIVIPANVINISESAFAYCTSLADIDLDENNFFYLLDESGVLYNADQTVLLVAPVTMSGSYTVPSSVTSIVYGSFAGCSSLTDITIPDSVTSIAQGAFYGCSSLESITIPFVGGSKKTASDYEQYPFGYIFGTSSYDGGVATTQYYYCYSTSYTTSSTYYIPSSLKSVTVTGGEILYGAFCDCSSLTSIEIPDSVTSIGSHAFDNCSSLTSIEIPDSVTSIGDYAFWGCSSLTSVVIPDSVTSIGDYAFSSCSSLTSVAIGDSVTSIGSYAFNNCSSLTSIEIPDRVISIGEYAFNNCSSLTSIEIPNSVTSIGSSAFRDCISLTSIEIPDGVTSIRDLVFSYCSSLTSIEIPNSVTGIGSYAFYNCSSLKDVYYGGTNVQWNKIEIVSGNSNLTGATIHYNDSKPVLTHIAIKQMPTKTAYLLGEELDTTGLVLTADYFNADDVDVTEGFTVSGFDSTTVGTKTITVTYQDFTTTFTVTVDEPMVCQNAETGEKFATVEEALAATTSGTIKLLTDVSAGNLIINPNVTLDLNGYTLTANIVLVMDGGAIADGSGKLQIAKKNLVYASNEAQEIIPVWNGTDGYIFTKVTFQQLARTAGSDAAQYIFLPAFSNPDATALLADGGADNGVKVKVGLTWNNGQCQQFYTYGEDLVAQVFASGGKLVFSLTVTGITGIEDMTACALVESAAGVKANSTALDVVPEPITPEPTEPTMPTEPEVTEPTDPVEIMRIVKALGANQKTKFEATLTGVITEVNTPYSSEYDNVSVTMDINGTNDEICCYRIKGDGASKIDVGDTITVKGYIMNYVGDSGESNIEFVAGSKLIKYVKGVKTELPSYNNIIAETLVPGQAYKLGQEQTAVAGSPWYYFNGKLANDFYLGTSEDGRKAVDVFVAEVSGGYNLYFKDTTGAVRYINIVEVMGIGGRLCIDMDISSSAKTVYTFNTEKKVLTTMIGDTAYCIGTYNNYTTMAARKLSSIDMPAYLMTLEELTGSASMEEAAKKLQQDYPNGYDTDKKLPTSITIRGEKFIVTWALETTNEAAVKIVDGVVIETPQEQAANYKLTATITKAGTVETTTISFNHTIDHLPKEFVENPVAGTAYKLGMYTPKGILLFNGTISGKYLGSVDDSTKAANVYLESVAGGYLLYFMDGETKTYIRIYENDPDNKKGSLELVTKQPAEVLVYDEIVDTLVYTAPTGQKYFMGTYSSYTTFSVSSYYYVEGDNAANVDVTQYPARFYPEDVKVEPAPIIEPSKETLTIAEAIEFGKTLAHNNYSGKKYYVTGMIIEVTNTQYGNMKIKDDDGNTLTLYGTYNEDGKTSYGAMDVKPVAGDTITVYGIIGQYGGAAQMKNGWITEHIPAEGGAETPEETEPETTVPEETAANEIKLTVDSLGLPDQSYTAGTATVNGANIEWIQLGNYGNGIQVRDKDGKTSYLWNTTAFPGAIKEIKLVANGSKNVYNNPDCAIFSFGSELDNYTYETKLSAVSGQYDYTIIPDGDYTFFKFEHDLSYTQYWDSITVVLVDDGTGEPEETTPSEEENHADLVVNFAEAFNNAGVAANTYLQNATSQLNAAYESNKWTVYCGGTDASIKPNNLYAGGRNRVGFLEIRNNNIPSYGATATMPSQFVAPGTGEYRLSVTYGTASVADRKGTEIGAYILEMPETHYNKYNVPSPTASDIMTKVSVQEPGNVGTMTAENTVMLKAGVEYIIVFYVVSPDETVCYANFAGFALNYENNKPAE